MRIFQILVTIEFGDAISNNVLLLDKTFKTIGINSSIYAINIGKNLYGKNIFQYDKFPELNTKDILIYHLCEHGKINADIKKMKCKKIAIYHNTTPAHFFTNFSQELCKNQVESILEIQSLNNSFDWCIADSEFNKQDLVKFGYNAEKITVIPILLDYEDYKKTPDKKTIEKYNDGYINLIFVGRVVPNKKYEDIIRIYAWYKKHINIKSRLILIGSLWEDDYINKLKLYVNTLELQDVIFTGKISFQEILAFYTTADIFLCMSEHEGFCVPLVEAMMFDIPIVAYESTAVPYTLNGSGILVDEKNPVLVSKVIDRIVSDDEIRDEIIKKQQERLKDFNKDIIINQIIEIVNKVSEK
jgi:glycosyltransferase involved in cell wall biosynthesis